MTRALVRFGTFRTPTVAVATSVAIGLAAFATAQPLPAPTAIEGLEQIFEMPESRTTSRQLPPGVVFERATRQQLEAKRRTLEGAAPSERSSGATTAQIGSGFWSRCVWPQFGSSCLPLFSSINATDWGAGISGYFHGIDYGEYWVWINPFAPGEGFLWYFTSSWDLGPHWRWWKLTDNRIDPRYQSGHVLGDVIHVSLAGQPSCQMPGAYYNMDVGYGEGPNISGWSVVERTWIYLWKNTCPTPPPPPTATPTPTPSPSPRARASASPRPRPRVTATPTATATPLANVPTALSPQECINTLRPRFQWTATQCGGWDCSKYELNVRWTDSQGGEHTEISSNNVSGTFFDAPSDLVADRSYFWKVRGFSPSSTLWSNILTFTPHCNSTISGSPTPISPIGCVSSVPSMIQWTPIAGATGYRLIIAREDGVWLHDTSVVGTSHVVPSGLLAAGSTYSWKVKGTNAQSSGDWSNWVSFTTSCTPTPRVTPTPTPTPVNTPEKADKRPPNTAQGPAGAPASVGCPVHVVNGNMYLDQVDVAVPGFGPSLTLARSYNSENIAAGTYGEFGPGWNHSFERWLVFLGSDALLLRQADGTPLYFKDWDGNAEFDPYLPVTEQSHVVQETDGTWRRVFRAGGSETFDAQGRLVAMTDTTGASLTIAREPSGRILSITTASGRAVTLTYSGGKLTGLTGPGGLVSATYTYDANGWLEGVTYGDGGGYHFTYDGAGRLLTVTDPTSRVLESHTYDSQGRALTSSLAEGHESLTLAYEPLRTTVTDALGNVSTYDYADVAGLKRVVRVSGPCTSCGGAGGETQEWTYDDGGRVLTHLDAKGRLTSYEYDPDTGDMVVERDALLNATVYTYYADGRVKTVTTPDNATKTYTYTMVGLPETITEAVDGATSRRSRFGYNGRGQPLVSEDALGHVSTFAYDGVTGDLLAATTPGGATGNLAGATTSFTYDAMGRRLTATDPLGRTSSTSYDAHGRTSVVTAPDGTTTSFTYDLGGRQTAVTDPIGRKTHTVYDGFGRVQVVIDPLQATTQKTYDLMSRPTSITDAEGRTTRYEYDAYGRLARTIYPNGGVETLAYDADGRVLEKRDRKGNLFRFGYDALGRLVRKDAVVASGPAEPAVTYTYDVMGRMLSASNGSDMVTWTYDLLGRVLTESSEANSSTVSYSYDAAGNRLSVALNGSVHATYAYDAASRLESITHAGSVFGFAYDAVSQRTAMTYPNGIVTTYSYDPLTSRLLSVQAVQNGTVISSAAYAYDEVGNRTSKTTPDVAESYGYDNLDRLTNVARSSGDASSYAYDLVGNRLGETVGSAVIESTYDESNRLLSRDPGGNTSVEGSLSEPGLVTVNGQGTAALAGNRFAGSVEAVPGTNTFALQATDASGNAVTQTYQFTVGGQPITYQYDANGNLTQKVDGADTWTYEWNVENELTRVLLDGNEVARFTYDALGRRVQKLIGGVTHTFVYDGADILREVSGAFSSSYIHGPGIDEPLAREDGAGVREHYHADGLGSLVRITDHAGAVVHSYRYDVWGNIEAGAERAGFAFTGREWEPAVGMYYYRARWYDAKGGRFVSEDPIGLGGGINLYGYVGGRPATATDPLGLFVPDWVFWKPYFDWSQTRKGRSWNEWYNDPNTTDEERVLADTVDPNPAVDPVLMAAGAASGLMRSPVPPRCLVTINRVRGDAFRDEIADLLENAGRQVRTEVYKRTPFGPRRIDIEVSLNGKVLGGIETKVGGSPYTPSQRAKDMWLRLIHGYRVNVVRDH